MEYIFITTNGLVNETEIIFKVFSFHFKGCSDNSGVVGWLASHLKKALGSGVFVTCGQNSNQGGIFDYWGCPLELGSKAIEEVRLLINQGNEWKNRIYR